MKIYTEVVFEYDEDSKQMVEVSSKSYEHKGDVDLCRGQQHPAAWAYYQPGAMAPQTIPGSHPVGGYKGKTIPVTEGKWSQPWTETYWNRPYQIGHQGYTVPMQADFDYDVSPDWFQEWYQPYREAMIDAPVRNILGMSPTQGQAPASDISGLIGAGGQSAFVPLSEAGVDPALIQEAGIELSPAMSEAGFEEPLITRGVKGELQLETGAHELAKESYDKAIADIAEEKLIAGETQEQALGDISLERFRSQRGIIPAQESARALQATSGMHYSAPAERELTGVKTEQIEEKQDFKAQEAEVTSGYKEAISKLEGLEQEEETGWAGKEIAYGQSLRDIFGRAEQEAVQQASLGGQLIDAHRAFGPTTLSPHSDHWRANIIHQPAYTGFPSQQGTPWGEQNLWATDILDTIGTQVAGQMSGLQEAAANIYGG